MSLPQLHVKPGVDLDGLSPGGCRILAVVASMPLALGFSITITCGKEGHGPDDPHTAGNAIDLRTHDLSPAQILQVYAYAQQTLGSELFTTLYEVPVAERASLDPALLEYVYEPSDPGAQHIHCQVRKGLQFPPAPAQV